MTWNVRAITQSDNPGFRALEGLMVVVPLFLVLFAAAYYVMSQNDAANFTSPLARSDALVLHRDDLLDCRVRRYQPAVGIGAASWSAHR